MKLFWCVILFGAALAMPNPEWEMFKRSFDKAYTTEEEAYRRTVFEDNQKFIQKHNAEYAQGIHTHTVGINKFADLTNAEFVAFFNGYLMVNKTRGSAYLEPSNYKAPGEVDWRTKGYVTPVKNQKQCGSCWAFSATGSLEGQHFKKYSKLIPLSKQQLVDCSYTYNNHGCEGGLAVNAFKYIAANGGIESEDSYPYTVRDGRCKFNPSLVVATVTGFTYIKSGSKRQLKSAVATVGPISVAMDAIHQSFKLYSKGIYSEPKCRSTYLNHAVLVVGYGDDPASGESYWLVKNSFGLNWGMEGYFKITRRGNMCGIATDASYPMV